MIALQDLTSNQRGLIASYVGQASGYELSQRCEDLNESDFEGWPDEEKDSLCKMISDWNSDDPEEAYHDVMQIGSSTLVAFGAWLIQPEAGAK